MSWRVCFGTNRSLMAAAQRALTGGWCSHAWLEHDGLALHSIPAGGVRLDSTAYVRSLWPFNRCYTLQNDLSVGWRRALELVGDPWFFDCTRLVRQVLVWSGLDVPQVSTPIGLYRLMEFYR